MGFSFCLSFCRSGSLSICLSVCIFQCLSVCISICLSGCISSCLHVHMFVCMSVACLSACLSTNVFRNCAAHSEEAEMIWRDAGNGRLQLRGWQGSRRSLSSILWPVSICLFVELYSIGWFPSGCQFYKEIYSSNIFSVAVNLPMFPWNSTTQNISWMILHWNVLFLQWKFKIMLAMTK